MLQVSIKRERPQGEPSNAPAAKRVHSSADSAAAAAAVAAAASAATAAHQQQQALGIALPQPRATDSMAAMLDARATMEDISQVICRALSASGHRGVALWCLQCGNLLHGDVRYRALPGLC